MSVLGGWLLVPVCCVSSFWWRGPAVLFLVPVCAPAPPVISMVAPTSPVIAVSAPAPVISALSVSMVSVCRSASVVSVGVCGCYADGSFFCCCWFLVVVSTCVSEFAVSPLVVFTVDSVVIAVFFIPFSFLLVDFTEGACYGFPCFGCVFLFSSDYDGGFIFFVLVCDFDGDLILVFYLLFFRAFLSYYMSNEVSACGDYFYLVFVFCVFFVVSCVLGCVEGGVVF